ncbi:MAG: NFACT RNA binding domain-containing protein [Bacteroidota bacterium]
MLRNYYYLNRAVTELNELLKGAEVTEIFSQDKNLLLLSIPTRDYPYRHLEISTNFSLPYLQLKYDHRKAKKNVVEFTKISLPEKIKKISIADNDRIINIEMSASKLIFSIMGGKTNIYFIKGDEIIDQFKRSKSEDDIIKRIHQHNFISTSILHDIDLKLLKSYDIKRIRTTNSFISKEILHELSTRNKSDDQLVENFHQILSEIYHDKIKVFYSENEDKVRFIPFSFSSFQSSNDEFILKSYNESLQRFIGEHHRYEKLKKTKKEIEKFLLKELERTSNKLNKLHSRISLGDKSEEYYNLANLLSLNRFNLKKGLEFIEVDNLIDGNKIKIKLNPKNTPQESIDYYFTKAKDEKINFAKSLSLYNETERKYSTILQNKQDFDKADNLDKLLSIKDKLKISNRRKPSKKMEYNVKLKEYLIDNKYKVLVGKDSKSNDLLSTKIAKQNDYWFHARGLPGSHVVLRVDNPKEGIPKNILKIAAQITAFHSKSKTAKLAPVSYTFGKYVRKKKGMEPGKVLLMKENVLLVRPEIPASAILVTDD